MSTDYYPNYDYGYHSFPDNMLTCFDSNQLSIYQKAVEEYAKLAPEIKLLIDTGPGNNKLNDPALYIMSNRTDLSSFWQLFDQIKQAHNSQS